MLKGVEDKILASYTRLWDPCQLWTELHHGCAGNTQTHRLILRYRLFGLKFLENAPMSDNFDSLNELLNDLAHVDTNFSNEDLHGFFIAAQLEDVWCNFLKS